MKNNRIAIIDGIRSPFCKANGVFKDFEADELGAIVLREVLARASFPEETIDEVIMGNVLESPYRTNVARVAALKGGVPENVPAFTVNRNCASGMEAIASAANRILLGQAETVIAGGTESMSQFPILFPKGMKGFLLRLSKSKSFLEQIKAFFSFKPSYL